MNEPEENEHNHTGDERTQGPTIPKSKTITGEAARVIDSESIFADRREVWIRHGDEMYRLRLTSSGKLYLSK